VIRLYFSSDLLTDIQGSGEKESDNLSENSFYYQVGQLTVPTFQPIPLFLKKQASFLSIALFKNQYLQKSDLSKENDSFNYTIVKNRGARDEINCFYNRN